MVNTPDVTPIAHNKRLLRGRMYSTTTTPTWKAEIHVGLKESYNGPTHDLADVFAICREVTDLGGLGVSVTRTEYVYKNGSEHGAIVGIIQYPRFPRPVCSLRLQVLDLAVLLKQYLKQERLSVVFPDETIMLEDAPND